jgi:hypothetical protein
MSHTSASSAAMELDALAATEDGEDAPPAQETAADKDIRALRADMQQMLNAMRQERSGNRGGRAGPPGGRSNRGNGGAGREGLPRNLPRIPHLSPIQVKEYMDSGKCFGCGSTAHSARACPQRKEDGNGKPSWSN